MSDYGDVDDDEFDIDSLPVEEKFEEQNIFRVLREAILEKKKRI